MSPTVSVVIPTKDRPEALARTLASLASQTPPGGGFEIVVVDDGSTPDALAEGRRLVAEVGERVETRLLARAGAGPASARNDGAEAANGELLLLLGDDTEPAGTDLLTSHAELHARRPEPTYAVLGRITWTDREPISPFMHWLENGGPQFSFNEISPGTVPAETYFYSSHVSLKKSLFERVGGFDRRFPYAAIEDTELGMRLAEGGIELDYHPELLVLHDHQTTLAQSLERRIRVGRSAALYNQLHPTRPHAEIAAPEGPAWWALRALTPPIDLAAKLPLPAPLRERLWLTMHHARYAQGYRLGAPPTR